MAFLLTHQAGDFSVNRFFVKVQRVFAAATKSYKRLNFHDEFLLTTINLKDLNVVNPLRVHPGGQSAGGYFQRGLLDACRRITLDEGVVVGQKVKALSASAGAGCHRRADRTDVVTQVRRAGGRDSRAREGYFQEFYRVAAENGTKEGFGLGLSIVMRLCDALKRRVRMDSRPGRGTVFKIDLEPHEGWSGSVGKRQD